MKITAYYLVAPNDRLRELAANEADLTPLCAPFLVSSQEGGLTRPSVASSEYALRAKIFALLHLTNEYLAIPTVHSFFEGKRLNELLFDGWWILIPAGDIERIPPIGERYKVNNFPRSQVGPTNSPAVEEWLDRVVEF
jgi:hypothetical protein